MNDITMQLLAQDTRAHKLDYKHKVLEYTCSCLEFESLRWSFKLNGALDGTTMTSGQHPWVKSYHARGRGQTVKIGTFVCCS